MAPTASVSASGSVAVPQRGRPGDRGVGEQRQGDGFGGQERADLEQGDGGRADRVEPFQGDRPGGVHSALVVQHVAGGEQPGPVGPEAAQVVRGRQPGLFQVAGGLRGGQWEVAEFGGQFVGRLDGHVGDAGTEQRDGVRTVQHVDLDPAAQRAPPGVPGGDQHVPGAGGSVAGDVRGLFGVVEDQQPPVPGTEFGQYPVHHLGGYRVGGQAEPAARARNCSGMSTGCSASIHHTTSSRRRAGGRTRWPVGFCRPHPARTGPAPPVRSTWSRSCNWSSRAPRPVKCGFRAGTRQTRATAPGARRRVGVSAAPVPRESRARARRQVE